MESQNKKITIFLIILSFSLFFFTGCTLFKAKTKSPPGDINKPASKGPAPLYYDFGDVLIPGELKVDKKESFVYNSTGFSAGVLVLSGRVEIDSLITFFENNMIKDNWRKVCSFKSAHTLMLFQKENRWCVVSIHESNFTTHAKVWVAPTVSETGLGLLK
jgi:hypothetical protein